MAIREYRFVDEKRPDVYVAQVEQRFHRSPARRENDSQKRGGGYFAFFFGCGGGGTWAAI